MKQAAFAIMVISILSKVLGFTREMVQSYFYGASAVTDAYLISQTIPSQIFGFIAAGIGTGFIPMYSRILKEKGKLGADKYASNLTNILLILATVTVAIVLLFTQPVVKLFASGFSGETLALAMNFTRISVFAVYFSAILSILNGYLRLQGKYVLPSLASLPINVVIIVSMIISGYTKIYVLIIGGLAASFFPLFLIIPSVRKTGYRYQAVLDFQDKYIKKMVMIALPVIMSSSVSRINVLVDRTLASAIAVGGISALNYADRINGFVQGFFVQSLVTVLYPNISRMAADENIKGFKKTVSEAIAYINLLIIPATIGAMLFSKEIVSLLFGRGAFTPEAIQMTGAAFFYYSLGMIPIGLRSVLERAFYAFQDTKTPMINATIGVTINIVLNLILSKYMGLGGLALATSISAIVTAVLMFVTLRKKIGPFGLREITRSFIKISIASLLMGAFAYSSFKLMSMRFSQNLALIFAIAIGALTYAIIIYFMKIPEVDNTLAALKKRLLTKKNGRGDTGTQA